MKRILFVDNDPDFLATRAEFLERADFHVSKATTLVDAEKHLRDGWIHLAILDIRMMNDDDEKDVSGMMLINADFTRTITKIVLTSFNTPLVGDLVRAAQRAQLVTIDVIEKAEGPDALITAVNKAFADHVRINWNLAIDWKARDAFSLVRLIEPNLEGERLLNRGEELEDLFRRLFYEKDHIRIQRLLWQYDGRVALVVFAFKDGAKPEAFIVVCGQNVIVNEEKRRFNEFAPKAPGETGTKLNATEETTHFAANAYAFANIDLEKTQSLSDIYRFASPKRFKETLTPLFQKTLAEWHQDQPIRQDNSLRYLYHQRLLSSEAFASPAYFETRIQAIEIRAVEHKVEIERTSDAVSFISGEKVFSYPNPLPLLFQTPGAGATLVINVPGDLTGENILADESGHAWLTDFGTAGQAPLYWNYVTLEAVMRFDWVDADNLLRQQELEDCLINGEFSKPDIRGLEPEVRKAAQAIVALRKLAARMGAEDIEYYHLGIFYHALRRLIDFNPAYPLSNAELIRLIHIYLSMAMLAPKITYGSSDRPVIAARHTSGIAILDRKARLISAGNRTVQLTRQDFALFEYLFNRAGEVCTKKELVSEALQGGYKEDYVHTLVMRIRKDIEDDPEQPHYLVTEPSVGYRLIINPK